MTLNRQPDPLHRGGALWSVLNVTPCVRWATDMNCPVKAKLFEVDALCSALHFWVYSWWLTPLTALCYWIGNCWDLWFPVSLVLCTLSWGRHVWSPLSKCWERMLCHSCVVRDCNCMIGEAHVSLICFAGTVDFMSSCCCRSACESCSVAGWEKWRWVDEFVCGLKQWGDRPPRIQVQGYCNLGSTCDLGVGQLADLKYMRRHLHSYVDFGDTRSSNLVSEITNVGYRYAKRQTKITCWTLQNWHKLLVWAWTLLVIVHMVSQTRYIIALEQSMGICLLTKLGTKCNA
jgi:hypothetical protein